MKYFPTFLIMLIFLACKEKEILPMNGEISIALEFQPYVDQFIKEAAVRGIDIDFSDTGLTMQFGRVDPGAAAICRELGDDRRGSHIIEFDRILWDISEIPRKEFLVFHELGHCELKRTHQNDQLFNGEWLTMMQGRIPNEPTLGKNSGRAVSFLGFRKKYYLDELFGLSPDEPEWTRFTAIYNDLQGNQKDKIFEIFNERELQQKIDLTNTNYELEITLNRLKEAGDIGLRYGTLEQSYLFKIAENNNLLIEWAGKVPAELEFFTGGNVNLAFPYRLFFCDNFPFDNQAIKLTVRQENGIASFFLNEQLLYHVDALTTKKLLIGAIQSNGNVNIENFIISAL